MTDVDKDGEWLSELREMYPADYLGELDLSTVGLTSHYGHCENWLMSEAHSQRNNISGDVKIYLTGSTDCGKVF